MTTRDYSPRDWDPLSRDFFVDPYPVIAWASEQAPLFRSPTLDAWVAGRFEDVEAIIRNQELFSSTKASEFATRPEPEAVEILTERFKGVPALLSADPPVHTRIRALVAPLFTRQRLLDLRPRIRSTAEEQVRRMLPALHAGETVDLVEEFTFPLPARTVLRFLGIPEERLPLGQLERWTRSRRDLIGGRLSPSRNIEAARDFVRFWEFCEEEVAGHPNRHTRPGAVAELVELVPDKLTPAEATSVVFSIAFAGHITVTDLIGNMLLRLLSGPGLWRIPRERPELVPEIVEESLRMDPPAFGTVRVARRDIEIGGQKISAGEKVIAAFGAANRDARVFDAPQDFIPGRKCPVKHLTFGRGPHYCLGAVLGRLEAEITLEVLTTELPDLELDGEQSVAWTPNFRFRGPRTLPVRLSRVSRPPTPSHLPRRTP